MRAQLKPEGLLSYMPGVAKWERALRELNIAWRSIESTARRVCPAEFKSILPTVHATRDGFTNFEKELLTTWYSRSMARNSPCLLLPAGGICRSAALKSPLMGMLNFACGENEKQVLLPVIDMHGLIRSNAPNPIGPSEIIVARHGARLLGFCVSGLIEVLDVRRNAIEPAVESSRPDEAYVRQIIKRAQ